MTKSAPVTILLATFNGAAYLPEQLTSIATQTHTDWVLIARDDGSSDDTVAQLDAFAAIHPATVLRAPDGAGTGSAANFLHLLRHAAPTSPQWIAFCDQDDVWLPDKLARAQAALSDIAPDTPALYCSRTWIVPDTTPTGLAAKRLSAPRPKPASFQNALVQNIASGNTILLNPAAARLICAAAPQVDTLVAHDWWVYQLITGAGGHVIHDDTPSLYYRQHGENQIGANDTFRARLKRLSQLLRGDFRAWNRVNVAALTASADVLSPSNRTALDTFAALPDQPLMARLTSLRRLGLYRQTRTAMAGLWVAALFGLL